MAKPYEELLIRERTRIAETSMDVMIAIRQPARSLP